MKRRNFIKYMSIVTAGVLLPNELNSATTTNTNPLFIFIQASGGWDVTSLCDPKGYLANEIDVNNRVSSSAMNMSYANKDIITMPNGIQYPPITVATHGSSYRVIYDYSTFFNKFENRLLVVNGIDTQTNGHSSGSRFLMSGKLAEGYPAISALIAGINLPASPLGFITSGGYDYTDNFVPSTRISNASTLTQLSNTNKISTNPTKTDTFVENSVFTRIEKMRIERIDRLISKQKLESIKNLMTEFKISHSGSSDLIKFDTSLKQLDTTLDAKASTNTVFEQGRMAMAGYKAGLTASVNISKGGFDTHSNNDRGQLSNLSQVLEGIDLLDQEAINLGIADRIVYIVGSEFGRTPAYNGNNGKDHWSVSSMMFIGAGINKTGVIGSTTHTHKIEKINPTTLQKDANGIKMTYAHINKALRKLAKIDTNAKVTQYYPLPTNIETLNLFG